MPQKNTNKNHSSKPFVILLSVLMLIYLIALGYYLVTNFLSQKTLADNQKKETEAKQNLDTAIQTDEYKRYLMSKKIYELRTIPWYDSITQLVSIQEQLKAKLGPGVAKEFVVDMNQAKMNGTVSNIDSLYNKKDGVLQTFDDVLSKVYQQNNLIKPLDYLIPQISHDEGKDYDFALIIKLSNGNKK